MDEFLPQQTMPMPGAEGGGMYEQMKNALYNPWFQFGLGVLGGNSGKNKTEAFANAMSGGLGAAQNAQRNRYQTQEEMRAQQIAKREQEKYDRALSSEEEFKKFATSMAGKNPGDPFWQAAIIDPKWGLDYYRISEDIKYKQASLEIDKMKAAAYAGSVGGGGRGGARGWVPDYTISDTDFQSIDAQMSVSNPKEWEALDEKEKRAYALQIINQLRYQAKAGLPPGQAMPAVPPHNPGRDPWYKQAWNGLQSMLPGEPVPLPPGVKRVK